MPRNHEQWHKTMKFMYLYGLNYAYRVKTTAIFDEHKNVFFDFFFVNDELFV